MPFVAIWKLLVLGDIEGNRDSKRVAFHDGNFFFEEIVSKILTADDDIRIHMQYIISFARFKSKNNWSDMRFARSVGGTRINPKPTMV